MNAWMNRVRFSYGDNTICHDLTWHIPSNGVVCLWGPSGCGKTTLLRLLAGLETPADGDVENVGRVSMVFQEDRLLPWLSALDNVAVTGASASLAADMLAKLGLTQEEMSALPRNLSGGQQRRVALARALVADSDILLMDEPFNGLDEDTWQTIVPLITEYAQNRPVVLVTHIRQQAEMLRASMIALTATPLSGELTAENL